MGEQWETPGGTVYVAPFVGPTVLFLNALRVGKSITECKYMGRGGTWENSHWNIEPFGSVQEALEYGRSLFGTKEEITAELEAYDLVDQEE